MKTLLCLFIATVIVGCVPKNDITLNVGSVSTPQTNSSNIVNGCTDHLANNYDSSATNDDNSCTYSSPQAILVSSPPNLTYSSSSITNFSVLFSNNLDGGDYKYKIINPSVNNCSDPTGYSNFISTSIAITDDVSSFSSQVSNNTKLCLIARSSNLKNPSRTQIIPTEYIWNTDFSVSGPAGCMDITASNYDSSARVSDGSCTYIVYGCMDPTASNYNPSANNSGSSTCTYNVYGCTNQSANNYNPNANADDGSCVYVGNIVYGCTNQSAINYNSAANSDDGSCIYSLPHASISSWSSPGNSTFTAIVSSTSNTSYYLYKVVPHYYSGDGITECQDSSGYIQYHGADLTRIDGDLNSFSGIQNNDIRLCVLAVDYAGNIQNYNDAAYSNTWYYSYTDPCSGSNYSNLGCPGYVAPPQAQLANMPTILNISTATSMNNITVTSTSVDSHYYRYKVFSGSNSTCSDPMNYSSFPILLSTPINWTDLQLASIANNDSSPNNTICVVVDDAAGFTHYENPASASWLADYQAPSISGMEVDYSSIPNPLTSWSFTLATNPQSDMNVSHYKYKLIANDGMSSCLDSNGYVETAVNSTLGFNVSFDSFGMVTGDVLMCVLAVDYANNVQSLDSAYSTIIHFQAPSSSGGGPTFIAGDGTDNNPYQIWTVDDLELARTTGDYSYKLMADIDLTGITFLPLFESGYSKTFDGNNHIILNWIYSDISKINVGFFSYLSSGSNIKNLIIKDAQITGKSAVGILAGASDNSTIMNCHVSGIVKGDNSESPFDGGQSIGGLIGDTQKGTIEDSSVDATVEGEYVVGGLVGGGSGVKIKTSFAKGAVKGSNSYVGGLVGYYAHTSSSGIMDSYTLNSIERVSGGYGGCYAGFVGYLSKNTSETSIINSFSSSSIINFGSGFLGCTNNTDSQMSFAVSNSFYSGIITGPGNGAFVDSLGTNINFNNVFFDISSSGKMYCSGSGQIISGCDGVNINQSEVDYFHHGPVNLPFAYDNAGEMIQVWDFVNTWQNNDGSLPTLKNNP